MTQRFQVLSDNRLSNCLEQIEASRALMASAVMPIAINLLRVAGILLLCRVGFEFTWFGGIDSFSYRSTFWLIGFGIISVFTIAMAIAAAFVLTLLFDQTTRGLLSKNYCVVIFGTLSAYLATTVWFNYLPKIFLQDRSISISIVVVLFSMLMCVRVSRSETSSSKTTEKLLPRWSINHLLVVTTWVAVTCVFGELFFPIFVNPGFMIAALSFVAFQFCLLTILQVQLNLKSK